MKTRWIYLLAGFAALTFAEHPNLKPYPETVEGKIRHVIELPEREDEQDVKVELIVGKTIVTDPVNAMRLGGSLERKTVKGWGYPYYEAEFGGMASTLMAPMPGTEDVERFVHLPGKLIRYNSRLPVVVYTPEGGQVKYRIWTAGELKEL